MTLAKIAISFKQYEELEATDLMICVLHKNLMSAQAERDAYAKAADTMAAAHKVERDALTNAARFALDALEYHMAQTRPIERTQIAIEILKAVL